MRNIHVVAVLALAATCPLSARAASGEAATQVPKSGLVVVGEAKAPGATFAVKVGDCARGKGAPADAPAECAVVVTSGAARFRLEWTAKAGPIAHPHGSTALVGDDPETRMSVSWKPILVGKGIPGVIVTQVQGGERIKHRHDVLLLQGGRLVQGFTFADPRGQRTWSSIVPVDMNRDGFVELAVMQSANNDEELPDAFSMQLFGWRRESHRIVEMNALLPTVQGALVGWFKSAHDARAFASNACLQEFLVLDNKTGAALLADGDVVVAAPAVTRADADLILDDVKACNEALSGAVKPLTRALDVPEPE